MMKKVLETLGRDVHQRVIHSALHVLATKSAMAMYTRCMQLYCFSLREQQVTDAAHALPFTASGIIKILMQVSVTFLHGISAELQQQVITETQFYLQATKPPRPTGMMGASDPPAMMMSASPFRIWLAAATKQ